MKSKGTRTDTGMATGTTAIRTAVYRLGLGIPTNTSMGPSATTILIRRTFTTVMLIARTVVRNGEGDACAMPLRIVD